MAVASMVACAATASAHVTAQNEVVAGGYFQELRMPASLVQLLPRGAHTAH